MGKCGIGANQLRQFDNLIAIHRKVFENKTKTNRNRAICSQVFWEFMGGPRNLTYGTTYSGCSSASNSMGHNFSVLRHYIMFHGVLLNKVLCRFLSKNYCFPSIPMASLLHRMRTRPGHQTTPSNKYSSRFHTGTSLSSDQEIRRASEQTSPQVARAAGHPASRDEGGGLISGSRSTRRFHFKSWGSLSALGARTE